MKFSKLNFITLSALVLVLTACSRDTDITNAVPVANAGPSQNVTLPFSNITLSGSGTDQDGQIVAYLWSQVAGPAPTVITNPGAASTTVGGFVAGNYIFQLMVTDNVGATGVDTVSIKVNPSPQLTLTLQPSNNPNEKSLVQINGSDFSSSAGNEWLVYAWTVGGLPYNGRTIFKFDLSTIPSTATIVSADLFLYSNIPPENGNLIDANFGNNAFSIQQITSTWSTGTANWFNQPTVTTNNQVVVASTTSSTLDMDIDVKPMLTSMVSTSSNYGFMMKLQNETPYNSRVFVSSFHATKVGKHPKLVVVYRP
jgi:hypothetical protein